MKRRNFLLLLFYILNTKLYPNSNITHWDILEKTLSHLFPNIEEFNMMNFIKLATNNHYFNKNDLKFIINGTKIVLKKNANYMDLEKDKVEYLLRDFELSSFGQRWLSLLIYYGLESMLSDPIYGGNKNSNGWKQFSHNAGVPRPITQYGLKYV